MPWYHFTARHGGGHQSFDEKYEWHDKRLSKEEKHDKWESWVPDYWGNNGCYGDVKTVRRPPKTVRDRLLAIHQHAAETAHEKADELIASSTRMLERLVK